MKIFALALMGLSLIGCGLISIDTDIPLMFGCQVNVFNDSDFVLEIRRNGRLVDWVNPGESYLVRVPYGRSCLMVLAKDECHEVVGTASYRYWYDGRNPVCENWSVRSNDLHRRP